MEKTSFYALSLVIILVLVTGCGTVKGFGEDLRTVGGWFVRGSDNVTTNSAR